MSLTILIGSAFVALSAVAHDSHILCVLAYSTLDNLELLLLLAARQGIAQHRLAHLDVVDSGLLCLSCRGALLFFSFSPWLNSNYWLWLASTSDATAASDFSMVVFL